MNRIIFIYNLAVQNIQFYELVDKLNRSGNKVMVYDLISSKKYDPYTKEIAYFNPFFGAKHILKIRYFRALFKPLINKKVIEREFTKNDTINLHYLFPQYSQYAELLKKKAGLFLITFWGSDVLRADDTTLTKYIPLFNSCDAICVPQKMQEELMRIYSGYNKKHGTNYNYDNKFKTIYFGISIFDNIKKVNKNSIVKFKEKYNLFKNETIYITIAHNGSPGQQHNLLIDKLKKINTELKDKIFLLLPFTYGADSNYKKEVLANLKESDLKYHLFTQYMDMQELAVLRVISNINLNIQVTDGFSASISEGLFANNIVLVGDWLPYAIYEEWGIKIFRENMNNFENRMIDIINNYDKYSQQVQGNSRIVYDKLSWKAMLPKWEKLYKIN